MTKEDWLIMLAMWDRKRAREAKYCQLYEPHTFICCVAEDVSVEWHEAVQDALTADGIGIGGEGFMLSSEPSDIGLQPWTRKELASPEFTADDRRRWWLLEQIERTP